MLVDLAYPILLLVSYLQVQWFTVVCSIRLRLVYTKAQVLGVFQLRVGFSVFCWGLVEAHANKPASSWP